jgi:hypothetical protein
MSGMPADLGLHIGAGDGNRTRTISLGIRQIRVPDRPDLDIRCTVSDRHRPSSTGVNGPPMARRQMAARRLAGHSWVRLAVSPYQSDPRCAARYELLAARSSAVLWSRSLSGDSLSGSFPADRAAALALPAAAVAGSALVRMVRELA